MIFYPFHIEANLCEHAVNAAQLFGGDCDAVVDPTPLSGEEILLALTSHPAEILQPPQNLAAHAGKGGPVAGTDGGMLPRPLGRDVLDADRSVVGNDGEDGAAHAGEMSADEVRVWGTVSHDSAVLLRSMRRVSRHCPAWAPRRDRAILSRRPTTRNPAATCSWRLALFSGKMLD